MQSRLLAVPDFLVLLRFWADRRAGRALPEWDGGIAQLPRSLLPNLAIGANWPDPVYRYLGAEIVRCWGSDQTGRRAFGDVLQGDYLGYIRSLGEDAIAHLAPIFSAAAFHRDEHAVISGRLFAPFTERGSDEPTVVIGLQLFKVSEQPLAVLGSGVSVHELERFKIAAAPEVCARLEAARRYQHLAGSIHQDEMVDRLDAVCAELIGEAFVPLPCWGASERGPRDC